MRNNTPADCVCKHARALHVSYNETVAGPYCSVKKCSCHLYIAQQPPAPTDGYSICLKAIEILQRDGWCQGTDWGKDGQRDIVTAIDFACEWKRERKLKILDRIFSLIPELLMKWNDEPGRTKQDCIDLLLLTADSFKEENDVASQFLVSSSSNAGDPELNPEGCS